jgi:hypothetical protein
MMRRFLTGLLGAALLPLPLMAKDEPNKVPIPPGAQNIIVQVQPYSPPAPPVSIQLDDRHGHITPTRTGFTHTGGGYIDIQQPTPDALVITMTGVAVAGPHPCKASYAQLCFDLNQLFEVSFDDPKVKAAKITMEARVIGVLRGGGKGTAEESNGCATVSGDNFDTVSVCAPPHSVSGCDDLSVNCHGGPVSGPIKAGKYALHGTWTISAAHPRSLGCDKAASAEFDPAALDPLWISYWEPYHGIKKTDFGLQISIKVADDTANLPAEPVAPPKPK